MRETKPVPVGSIYTFWDDLENPRVETSGSPPDPIDHEYAVLAAMRENEPSMAINNGIITIWHSQTGGQGIEVTHTPITETDEEWKRKWIRTFRLRTGNYVPI